MKEKYCNKCRRSLPLTEFYTFMSGGRWLCTFSYCKECHRQRQREYYHAHREHYREYMREYNKIKT